MNDGLSNHTGIYLPLLTLAVLLVMVFAAGVLAGMFACWLLA